jgi:hypothetical protein
VSARLLRGSGGSRAYRHASGDVLSFFSGPVRRVLLRSTSRTELDGGGVSVKLDGAEQWVRVGR